MKLNVDYLIQRHEFWKEEIAKTGIWDAKKFKTVRIVIRKKSKTYNGLFHRKTVRKNWQTIVKDSLVIYNNVEEFDPTYLDSVLVHEMFHQYIIQNDIKDSRTHGIVFKEFMQKINAGFQGKLNILIRSTNPRLQQSGEGNEPFDLLLIEQKDFWYCCVVHPSRLDYFEKLVKKYKRNKIIESYRWMQSKDVIFNKYVRCCKRLHGSKHSPSDLSQFLNTHNITENLTPMHSNNHVP